MKQSPKYRLLLLNPPAPGPVFRDCYCSGPAKGPFFMHPLDLQVQSGFFPAEAFEIAFTDAVFQRLDPPRTLAAAEAFAPDGILSLVGQATMESDIAFFRALRARLRNARLFLSGDLARFQPEGTLEKIPEAHGLLTAFDSPSLGLYLCGGVREPLPNLVLRNRGFNQRASPRRDFAPPLPRETFVRRYRYQLPFFRRPAYYSLTVSYGCPYRCRYCNTHRLGYRERSLEGTIEELRFAARLGFRSLYIRDATFLVDKKRTLELFRAWREEGLRFEWICFTRPDLLDDELAGEAARLGCTLMMLGVESHDDACLREMDRGISIARTEAAFRLLRMHGIRSAAHVIAGMAGAENAPPDTRASEQNLRSFLRALDPDFLSLGVFARRPGISHASPLLTRMELTEPACACLAGAVTRWFYFRPRTVVRQLLAVQSPEQLGLYLKIAARLF